MKELGEEDLTVSLNDISSDSFENDSNQPQSNQNYNSNFSMLPKNVQDAIKLSKKKDKHSPFYYKLKNLKEKITLYKGIFYDKVPNY